MWKAVWGLLLAAYVAVVIPLSSHLEDRPVAVKLGYTPDAEVMEIVAADQRYALGESAVLKVMFYFGTLVEKWQNQVIIRPELYNMFKTIETAVKLDPYNMDAYYFAQAAFTWEVGHAEDVNRLLDYGMKYRTWDPMLPFFAGFNSAYFLKDYKSASVYMQKAAELSGNALMTKLAARYFYEAGETDLGIMFLETMSKKARDPNERRLYRLRREALLAVKELTRAVERFSEKFGRRPENLSEVVSGGLIPKIPEDPYGGRFFLDEQGKVRSTSKFAFSSGAGGPEQSSQNNSSD